MFRKSQSIKKDAVKAANQERKLRRQINTMNKAIDALWTNEMPQVFTGSSRTKASKRAYTGSERTAERITLRAIQRGQLDPDAATLGTAPTKGKVLTDPVVIDQRLKATKARIEA